MKKFLALAIGFGLVLSTVSFAQAPAEKKTEKKAKKSKKKKGEDKK